MSGRFVTTLAAVVVATGVFAFTAGAESPNNPKADIQQGNGFCGADLPALPVIGFANYHRTGNTVTVQYHLKNGHPNTEYSIVSLWTAPCTYLGDFSAPITTNKNGVANATGSITVPAGATQFFATSASFSPTFQWHDTPMVTLLP